MPTKIIQKKENNKAIVSLGGIEKEISTVLIEDAAVGDYVVIHAGFALTKLNEAEAQKTLALFVDMEKIKI